MGPRKKNILQSLLPVESEPQVLETMTSMARQLGFYYCAYGLRMPIPLSNPPVAMLCNYPVTWAEQYTARNYLAIDPHRSPGHKIHIGVCLVRRNLFIRTRSRRKHAPSVREGLASVCRDTGRVSGMLSLVRSGEAITEIEWQAISARVLQLGASKNLPISNGKAAVTTHCPNASNGATTKSPKCGRA